MKWQILGLCVLGLAAAGCEEQGPAETAGEQLDQAVEDVGEGAEDLRDEANELIDEAAERLEGSEDEEE